MKIEFEVLPKEVFGKALFEHKGQQLQVVLLEKGSLGMLKDKMTMKLISKITEFSNSTR